LNIDEQKRRLLGQLRRNISDQRVLEAMESVPREAFVPESSRHLAYEDSPLPIGEGQSISQPLIVAMMVASLGLKLSDKVLEVGTGSGYQTAILSLLAREVISTERLSSLTGSARARLVQMGYSNVTVLPASDTLGCQTEASFDAIIVAAGAPRLPSVLLDQLAEGGRLSIPVGSRREQDLLVVEKTHDGYSVKSLGPCRFVPLVGPGAWEDDSEGHDYEAEFV
jgi:protein-L-isoaspartate(D-aspartate) O-methyltransferase